jgi:Tol biopolymer transport system component/DNA-binding SARP family transcriptional activator
MLLIRTLGGLSVSDGERLLGGALAQPRRTAILALLARAGERGMPRDRILALLWPDLAEERSRPNLAQAIYALRRDLGHDETIVGTGEVRLNPEFVSSDCLRFEAACRAARWQEAAELYRGPFLDGFTLAGAEQFNRWVDTERTALEHRFVAALEKLAVAASERGDHPDAVRSWRRLAGVDPLSGRTALRLMQALAAAGDRAGAIRHAQIHAELLQQELETAPDPDVTDYAERLRREPLSGEPSSRPKRLPGGREVEGSAVIQEAADPSTAPPADASLGMANNRVPRHLSRVTLTLVAASAIIVVIAVPIVSRLYRDTPLPSIGNTVRISADAELELDPRLSPDGTRIAYAAGAVGSTRLYVKQVNGGTPLAVGDTAAMPHRLPQWSPDGTMLWFQGQGGIYRVAALGGTPRLMVPDHPEHGRALSPALSPDGKRLAWVYDERLVIRDLADDRDVAITGIIQPHSPAWSPDGKQLAIASQNLAFVLGGTPPALGTSNLGNIASSALWLVDATGDRDPVQIATADQRALSPTWSPNGEWLLYLSDREGSRDAYALPIGRNMQPTGPPRRLTAGLGAHSIALSPDGRQLAYATFGFHNNIFAVEIPATGEVSVRQSVALTRGSQTIEGVAVSPDGRWLAYDSDLSGNQDLWRISTEGGDPERLTDAPGDDFLPAWSPDGSTLAFYTFQAGRRRLMIVPSTGGRVHTVVDDGADDRYPSWSPDGMRLLFSRDIDGHYDIFTTARKDDSTWGAVRQLSRGGGNSSRWSPDSTRFLYFRDDPHRLVIATFEQPDTLRTIAVGDGSVADPFPALAEWDPNGRRIFYKAFDAAGQGSLWVVNSDGSQRRRVVHFDDLDRPTSRPEFATDGRRLYFTVGKPEADVWVMTLDGKW